MSSITNVLNASIYSAGLNRSVMSSASQSVILGAAIKPVIPDMKFDVGGVETSLAQILNEALTNSPQGSLVNMLSSVGSYKSADSLLSAVYGVKSGAVNALF